MLRALCFVLCALCFAEISCRRNSAGLQRLKWKRFCVACTKNSDTRKSALVQWQRNLQRNLVARKDPLFLFQTRQSLCRFQPCRVRQHETMTQSMKKTIHSNCSTKATAKTTRRTESICKRSETKREAQVKRLFLFHFRFVQKRLHNNSNNDFAVAVGQELGLDLVDAEFLVDK